MGRLALALGALALVAAALALGTGRAALAAHRTVPPDVRRFLAITATETDAIDAASLRATRLAVCGLWTPARVPRWNAAQSDIAGAVLANADIVASAPALLRWLRQLQELHATDPALKAYAAYVAKEKAPIQSLARLHPFGACAFFTRWQKAGYPTTENAAAVLGPQRFGLLVAYSVYACTNAGVKTSLVSHLRAIGASRAQLALLADECIGSGSAAGGGSGGTKPPPKPGGPTTLPGCATKTQMFLSASSGPPATQISLDFGARPANFDGFELFEGSSMLEVGGGYPSEVKAVVKGTVGQHVVFTLVRSYDNAGLNEPTCVSARATFTITNGPVKQNPPPPPAGPTYPRCPEQATLTLSATSGPSPTQVKLQFSAPTERWDGFYLYRNTSLLEDGGGSPSVPLPVLVTGATGQRVIFTLVRAYANGGTIEPTCIAASATFTIS